MSEDYILKNLEQAVFTRSEEKVRRSFKEMEGLSLSPEQILKALTAGMEEVRKGFQKKKCSIPEFLLSVDVFRDGINLLRLRAPEEEAAAKSIGIVIGVVEGDVHDMGKNIISAVLEASGYLIYDVGRDVPKEVFLDALEKNNASLLALSTMMSTPQEKMKETIQWTRKLYPDVGILVGGASVNERLALNMGADGYAESAIAAPDEVARLVSL